MTKKTILAAFMAILVSATMAATAFAAPINLSGWLTLPTKTTTTGTKAGTTTTNGTKTGTTSASTAASTPATTGSMSADESRMINLVNQERTKAGLKPYTYDSSLRAAALSHSRDMSQNNFFSHTSPTKGTFSQRLAASGVKHTAAGENLALNGSVDKAHVSLMNSSGHRANIMSTAYTRIGIGIVYNQSKGAYYITQWFAK